MTGDLFHYGHISFFKKAREFGTKLIVGICSDDYVSAYKRRPILNLKERSEVIRNCVLVDEVVIGAPPATDKNFILLNGQGDTITTAKPIIAKEKKTSRFYYYTIKKRPTETGSLKKNI